MRTKGILEREMTKLMELRQNVNLASKLFENLSMKDLFFLQNSAKTGKNKKKIKFHSFLSYWTLLIMNHNA